MDKIPFKDVNLYDWIPFFKEIGKKLYEIGQLPDRNEVLKKISIECFGSDSQINKYEEIDPFSFIYFLAQRNTKNQKTNVYTKVRIALNIQQEIPTDWIYPTPTPNTLVLFHRGGEFHTDLFWNIFNAAQSNTDIPENDFKDALRIKGVGCSNLTQTLYLINPTSHLPIDNRLFSLPVFDYKKYFELKMYIETEGLNAYKDILLKVKSKFPSCEYYEINLLAYLFNSGNLNIHRNYFQIGSNVWGGDEDYIDDFYSQSAVWVGSPVSGGDGKKEYPIYDPQSGDIILSRIHSKGNGIGIVLDNEYLNHGKFHGDYKIKVVWINKTEKEGALNASQLQGFSRARKGVDSFAEQYKDTFLLLDNLANGDSMNENKNTDGIKNLILQGPPGTGKTRLAKQLALYLQEKNASLTEYLTDENKFSKNSIFTDDPEIDGIENIKIVQFHPGYTYEDFIRGIVTETDSDGKIQYKVQDKIFMQMVKSAQEGQNNGEKYVLIIDEMNRANLPAVLGELIYGLEYRGEEINSIYKNDETGETIFTIPDNLYIIGTMNTADRSIGHIDYAIRRRFVFTDVLSNIDVIQDAAARALYQKLEDTIFDKDHISPEFRKKDIMPGHSYFLVDKIPLTQRLKFEIKPLLKEYEKDGILIGEDIEKLIEEL
jgi:hypothetical protein